MKILRLLGIIIAIPAWIIDMFFHKDADQKASEKHNSWQNKNQN